MQNALKRVKNIAARGNGQGGVMASTYLSEKAAHYLRTLCQEIPGRQVGSAGNQAATQLFAGLVSSFGFETECSTFECIDWTQAGAELSVGDAAFAVQASPYSLGCRVRAPLAVVSRVEELEQAEVRGQVLLLRGEIAREQLMPKNFTFYNPDEHKRIVRALESAQPLAIVAATSRNPELAGGLYPFPLIEDGDFDIPSVFMTEEEGDRLAEQTGQEVRLESRAQRIPSQGSNVVGRKGADAGRRAVLFAHIDAKQGTPGALDNASGVATLLLLAELLRDYSGRLMIEIVALNGEDYYGAQGEKLWVAANEGHFDEIVLGINLDGAGHREGRTAYSLYGCPPELEDLIRQTFAAHPDLVEGERWYQSDHSLFLMYQRPALAITSQGMGSLWTEVAHTAGDRPELVDPAKLVEIAQAICELLLRLEPVAVESDQFPARGRSAICHTAGSSIVGPVFPRSGQVRDLADSGDFNGFGSWSRTRSKQCTFRRSHPGHQHAPIDVPAQIVLVRHKSPGNVSKACVLYSSLYHLRSHKADRLCRTLQ
jgi:aminopeptidase YwaD